MGKWKRLTAFLLIGMLTLGILPHVEAVSYEKLIDADKTVSQTEEDSRTFQMDISAWSDDALALNPEPHTILLTLEYSKELAASYIAGKSRLSWLQEAVSGLVDKVAEHSPQSRIGMILFGKTVISIPPKEMSPENRAQLIERFYHAESLLTEGHSHVSAMKKAAVYLKSRQEDGEKNLDLINIASDSWNQEEEPDNGEAAESERTVQEIRALGTRIYSVYWNEEGNETNAALETLASVPSEHYFLASTSQKLEGCVEQILQGILGTFSVTVKESIDPRFQIPSDEKGRLLASGAEIREEDGHVIVEWDVSMPRKKEQPWTDSILLQARHDFPGGNDVALNAEGSGIYKSGKLIREPEEAFVNVPIQINPTDVTTVLAKGERVPSSLYGRDIELLMRGGEEINWYGKGQTGSFSYLWKKEDGGSIGTVEQLSQIVPAQEERYLLTVTYEPSASGVRGVGSPVEKTEWQAFYCMKLIQGEIMVEKTLDRKLLERVGGPSAFLFQLDGEGRTLYQIPSIQEHGSGAGQVTLQATFSGLDYGTYSACEAVCPLGCSESTVRECSLGKSGAQEAVSLQSMSRTLVLGGIHDAKEIPQSDTVQKQETFHLNF